MIWSVFKIILFVLVIAAAALGAGALLESHQVVRITALNTEFTLSPLAAVIAFLVLVLVIWLVLKLLALALAVLRFLNGDQTAISRYFHHNRERKGYQALADGMLALAAGETRAALAKATRAGRLLKRPDLTDLLSAQVAQAAGNSKSALAIYKRMLGNDRTRFVGMLGLLKQKLAAGDTLTAMRLAEKALALRPRNSETQDTLLKLQAENEDWAGARKTLALKLAGRALPRNVFRRRDAVLAYAEAREALAGGDVDAASRLAVEANRMSADLIPAAVLTAQMHIRAGKPRQAAKVIQKAWASVPHPDLAAAFAEIAPDETPTARRKRFQPLLKARPGDAETRMLKAELDIAAEDFPAAKRALGDLSEPPHLTMRSATLMAAIERGEGADDAVVRGWLSRALTAPRGPQWICSNCHRIHAQWVPICENCGQFDSLTWTTLPEEENTLANATAMLPLIVGTQAEPAAEQASESTEREVVRPTATKDMETEGDGAAASAGSAD